MKMDTNTYRLLNQITDAMQPAEDMGGPEGQQYRLLMEAIMAEAQGRLTACQSHCKEAGLTNRDNIIIAAAKNAHETDEVRISNGPAPTYLADDAENIDDGVWVDAAIYLHGYEVETALQYAIDSGYCTADELGAVNVD